MFFKRTIQSQIEEQLFKGKVMILYGARRVGKTTLVREIEKKYSGDSTYLNCDEPDIRSALTDKTSTELRSFIGSKKVVFIDEAQRVRNIGLTLKLLVDAFPEMQIIATGSSSFDLANEVVEPLTGRSVEFQLFPFSYRELDQVYDAREQKRLLEQRLVLGSYPDVITRGGREGQEALRSLTRNYLYKDVLSYQHVKNPDALEKLLQALALQIGNEVSYTEIASLVGIDKKTVESYVRVLEQAFIIFRLSPLSRNLRNELSKMRKIYFVDVGIRNALIRNLNPLNLRQDTGPLRENYLISERLKLLSNSRRERNRYFWRTHQGQEIDYLEEEAGRLSAYECKWSSVKKASLPKVFTQAYPGTPYTIVTRENYEEFIS